MTAYEMRISDWSSDVCSSDLVCVVFGLSVVWRGEASETAAGFWPPAGAALVAMLLVPVRRWGWVVAGSLVPTAVGLVLGFMPLRAGLIWGIGNRSEERRLGKECVIPCRYRLSPKH